MARSKTAPRKVWRVGNFVLRKGEVPTLGADEWSLTDGQVAARVRSGEIGTVEVLEVSSLDGAWMTRFMPGSVMSSLLMACLEGDGEDAPLPEWMEMVLTNIMSVSAIPNGYFHQALALLLSAYCDPSLISGGLLDGKARQFRREAKKVREAFLAWRRDYDSFMLSQDDDDDFDEKAHEVRETLEP